eukprot:6055113-Prymnesium_polylepis.1
MGLVRCAARPAPFGLPTHIDPRAKAGTSGKSAHASRKRSREACGGSEMSRIGPALARAVSNIPPWCVQVIYGLVLLWLFAGVAIVADIFMNAIERITSQEKKVFMEVKGGARR